MSSRGESECGGETMPVTFKKQHILQNSRLNDEKVEGSDCQAKRIWFYFQQENNMSNTVFQEEHSSCDG